MGAHADKVLVRTRQADAGEPSTGGAARRVAPLADNRPQAAVQREQVGARHSPLVQASGPERGTRTQVAQRVVLSKVSGHWENEERDDMDSDTQSQSSQSSQSNPYIIDDIIIGGRTPSPFAGTMGAHSTAWIAHIDAVRRRLVGATMGEGIQWLGDMAREDLASPLLKLDGYLNPVQQANLGTARYHLQMHLAELGKFTDKTIRLSNYSQAIDWLRSTINAYLTFVNFLPLSTVEGGNPGGNGEGASRNELNEFEYGVSKKHGADKSGGATADEYDPLSKKAMKENELGGIDSVLKKLLRGKLDENGLDSYRKRVRATLVNLFAKETPDEYANAHDNLKGNDTRHEVWALALQNFLRTVRLAYPYAYDFAGMAQEDVIKAMITELNGSLDAEAVYQYLDGKKKFTAIGGSYTFHGTAEQNDGHKNRIEAELGPGHKLDEAEVRPAGAAVSDVRQGGSGFGSTVLVDAASGKIGDVVINGRTKTPFGTTMGAHTTAWTVHVDAVIRLLKGKTLPQAIRSLANRARMEMSQNKALKYAGHISEKHQIFLVGGFYMLKSRIGSATGSIGERDQRAMTDQLEALIHDYLNFVNLTPTSTIEVGRMPNGRAEGIHRTFLNRYEEEGDKVFTKQETTEQRKEIILQHLLGMLDGVALSDFPPLLGKREPTDINAHVEGGYNASHPLYPHISVKKSTQDKGTVVRENFLHTIEDAYPRSAAAAGLAERIKRDYPQVETQDEKRQKLLNKRAMIVRNPADPESSLHVGAQVEIKSVYGEKASVLLLATHNLARTVVDLASLKLE